MSQEHDAVITWIKAGALPLTTLDPRAPLDDFAAFEQIVGDAAIVGLGEGSHGAHECFLVKHRLLRFLVEQMGFTLVAMEMDWMRSGPQRLHPDRCWRREQAPQAKRLLVLAHRRTP